MVPGKHCNIKILEKACHRLLVDNCKDFGDVLGKVHMEDLHLLPHCLAQTIINSVIENPHKINCLLSSPHAELFLGLLLSDDGTALRYLPESAITPSLCLVAIKQTGLALQYVPEPLKSYDTCKVSVGRNGLALQYVPDCLRTYRICQLAIAQNGLALEFVPDKLRNPFFYLIAYANNTDAFQFFPPHYDSITKVMSAAAEMQDAKGKFRFMPVKAGCIDNDFVGT